MRAAESDAPQESGVPAPKTGRIIYWPAVLLEYLNISCCLQVASNSPRLTWIGNALHGVVQMLVKSGKEPKPVLSGESVGPVETTGLATWDPPALVDMYLETSLGKFVRSRHACYARAENHYLFAHPTPPAVRGP